MASVEIAAGLSELNAGDVHLRSYLRRALLQASSSGRGLLSRIVDLVVEQLERHGDPKGLPHGP